MIQLKRILTFASAVAGVASLTLAAVIPSPKGKIVINTGVDETGKPYYNVTFNGDKLLNDSELGLKADQADLTKVASANEGELKSFREDWNPVWGEFETITNAYNELPVTYTTPAGQKFTVWFRAYDDGVAFRYEVPAQPSLSYLTLRDEASQFNLADNMTLYCIPGDYDTDERLYVTTPMSDLGRSMKAAGHTESSNIPGLAVQTPMLAKTSDGKAYINIHEAALKGYPAMALDADTASLGLKAHLTPDKNGVRGYLKAPFVTPWRSVIITATAPEMLASQLILNLNDPCALDDTSWIKPMKFVGVWWEMFIGKKRTWAYSDNFNAIPGVTDYSLIPSNGRHPANTANVLRYIDFAAENGIDAVLVEGWNEGWEDWGGYNKNRQFVFDKPYPDFDIDSITSYAAKKGVKMIMHHETAANAADYERQLDRAFNYMNKYGYPAVKTGYVGHVIPRSEYHSSQWMVDHYIEVARRAAEHKIMVDSHEAVRPTGLIRTYPNWVAQESARGGEYESFGGNPPEHTVMLPFTRLKGGPMDYTPGLFEPNLPAYGEGATSKGLTTLARQLALYVTMASPIQMACDLPENYNRFPDAFQFIKDVPLDWSYSTWLEAEPGDYITVARRKKGSDDWYVGGVTDENPRTTKLNLSFLEPGVKYEATIYEDAPDAHYIDNPQAYRIRRQEVTSKTTLKQFVAPGGGFAIRITPKRK